MWREQIGSGVQNAEEALRSRMPFPASTVKAPKQKSQWAPDLLALELDLIREFRAVQTQPYKDNMTPTERRGLNEALRMRKSLRFSIGDKSGAFVVIDKEMDKQLATLTLSDASTYVRSNSNEFQVAFEELSRVTQEVLSPKLEKQTLMRLKTNHPSIPTFYQLCGSRRESRDSVVVPSFLLGHRIEDPCLVDEDDTVGLTSRSFYAGQVGRPLAEEVSAFEYEALAFADPIGET
ncbi:hypothetical protein Aduo_005192 [Ancylostoma duodenale]